MPPEPVKISLIAAAPPGLAQVSGLCDSLPVLPNEGFELIAAGPGMDYELTQILAEACAVRGLPFGVVNQQHLDLSGALDQALARATGEYVCLIPAGCALDPGFGQALLNLAGGNGREGILGGCLPRAGDSRVGQLAARETEFYGFALERCFAVERHLALNAGGLEAVPRRMAELGRELESSPELTVREPMPQTWPAMWRRQMILGRQVRDLKPQQLLMLIFLLLLITLGPADPLRALSLGAVCLLLLYPLDRPFIKHIGHNHPELLNPALLFCLIRPFVRLLGGLAGALNRFQG